MKSFKQFNEAAPKVIRRSKGKFIVFGYDNYYPVGTINDIVAEESTIQKAVAAIEHHRTTEGGAPEYGEYERYEILNMKSKKWFDHKGKPFEAAFRPLGTFGTMMVFAYDTRYPSGGASDWHDTVHNFDELDYKVLEDERSRNYEWDQDNIVVLDTKNGTWYRYR